MEKQPPSTIPKINIPALELGSVAQSKLRGLQRCGWVISGYALQNHGADELWPQRSILTCDGFWGQLPDQNTKPAKTCEISQTADQLHELESIAQRFASEYEAAGLETYREDVEKAARLAKAKLTSSLQSFLVKHAAPAQQLMQEVYKEFIKDGHSGEFEDGEHPIADRVRAFLSGALTPYADAYPPLPEGDHASAYVSDAQVFSASEMRTYVDADRAMRLSSISEDDRRALTAAAGLLAGHGHKGSSEALLRLLSATQEQTT